MLKGTELKNACSQQSCINSLQDSLKTSEKQMCSPIPVKRKTCNIKSWENSMFYSRPIISRSYNKFDELIKNGNNLLISPQKNKKTKLELQKNLEYISEFQNQQESKMVKSDEIFPKNQKHDDLKQLRNETKNPLGKEALFSEKSFENLKFVRDSLSHFDDLERLIEDSSYYNDEEFNEDIMIQKDLELMKELSIDND